MKHGSGSQNVVSFSRFLYQVNVVNDVIYDHIDLKQPEDVRQYLVSSNIISDNYFDMLLKHYNSIPQVNLEEFSPELKLLKLLPTNIARSYGVVVLARTNGEVEVGMKNPLDQTSLEILKRYVQEKISARLVDSRVLTKMLARSLDGADEIRRLAGDLSILMKKNESSNPLEVREVDWFNHNVRQHPAVELLREIVRESMRLDASDIHIEETGSVLRVRLRVEGEFVNYDLFSSDISGHLFRLILILAKLDIIESRLPQEGGFFLVINNNEVNLRLSVMPTHSGRTAVMRVLESDKIFRHIGQIVHDTDTLKYVRDFISSKHGLMFVTGPANSGKTTTLYTVLKELSAMHSKIITLEDPVEMTIDGVNQIEVKPNLGYGYIEGLKSAFRQDPNVLLVGEIREEEPARMVVRAANSGLKVMTSIHAQTCVSTLIRMIDFGIDPAYLAGSVSLILNQRLVHTLCEHCATDYEPTQDQIDFLRMKNIDYPSVNVKFRDAAGCQWCENIGYQGRLAVIESLVMSDEIKKVLLTSNFTRDKKSELINKLFNCAIKQIGSNDVQQKALHLACQGKVSLREVISIRDNLVDLSAEVDG